IGEDLMPRLSSLVTQPLHLHLAEHVRRTMRPPAETWIAFGPTSSRYEQDVHFKVAISRNCVRFLFEVGPESHAKGDWLHSWHREFARVVGSLRAHRTLAWFKNEHREKPNRLLGELAPAEIEKLANKLKHGSDGQFVLGRAISAAEFVGLNRK